MLLSRKMISRSACSGGRFNYHCGGWLESGYENRVSPKVAADMFEGGKRGSHSWKQEASNNNANNTQRRTPERGGVVLRLGAHVKEALANGEPIVALESTVITHGMPRPTNRELAHELEAEIRGQGAVPATVAIIKGQLVVGLHGDEIDLLANSTGASNARPIKASRRDIPVAVARRLSAGTTVAGTMSIVASLAPGPNLAGPIKVFATGGTGGVHRARDPRSTTMDISADLFEFSRSPLGVVSSGFKSFLDLGKSLEYLETIGCTVMSLATKFNLESNDDNANLQAPNQLFPAFYRRENIDKVISPLTVANVQEAASILFECLEGCAGPNSRWHDRRGVLIANPISERFAMDYQQSISTQQRGQAEHLDLEQAIQVALKEIDSRQSLEGRDKTPLILERLNRLTGGKSLEANVELLKNNARFGANLAIEYNRLLVHHCTTNAPIKGSGGVSSGRALRAAKRWPPDHHCISAETWPSHKQKENKYENENLVILPPGSEELEANAPGGMTPGPLVIGCTMIDMHVSTKMDEKFKTNPRFSGVTYAGEPHLAVGGVGRNLAVALSYLGCRPRFVTALANDALGQFASDRLGADGLSTAGHSLRRLGAPTDTPLRRQPNSPAPTSCFALVLRDSLSGQCEFVIANLRAIEEAIGAREIEQERNYISRAPLVVLDANLSSECLEKTLQLCNQLEVPVFLEPTDCLALPKLANCIQKLTIEREHGEMDFGSALRALVCLSPNLLEFQELCRLLFAAERGQHNDKRQTLSEISNTSTSINKEYQLEETSQCDGSIRALGVAARRLMERHLPHLKCLLITLDKRGLLLASRLQPDARLAASPKEMLSSGKHDHEDQLYLRHFAPSEPPLERAISGSGAGDSFAAAFIAGLLGGAGRRSLADCIQLGFRASRLALMDEDTIPQSLRQMAIEIEK